MLTDQMLTFSLSFEQQRLWFFHQLEPQLPLYNVPISHYLKGKLDCAALARSLNEVVSRHEVLRTTFELADGQPVQRIHPTLHVPLPMIDVQMFPADEREAEVLRLMEEEALRPFDLLTGPLLRAQLLQTGPEEFVLLLTMHHIVFDDWSIGTFYNELQVFYEAFRDDRAASLDEPQLQYADYALWQREWQEEHLAKQMAYWKEQLKGSPAVLELPTDRPRPATQSYQGALYFFSLPEELSQAVNTLGNKEGATLFMTLLATFQVLLARYSGQADVVVGSPIINRHQVELENIIGFFVNMLVLRSDLSDNPSFRELLQRVRHTVLDAYQNADLPFEKLVDGLQTKRDPSYTPLFQTMFALQNMAAPALKLDGLLVQPLEKTIKTAKFDLSLIMAAGKQLSGVIEYSTDLFDQATIARMVEHFQMLLTGIVASPDTRLTNLPLITAEERQYLMSAKNMTATDYPETLCFHQLFEAQAAKEPNAPALAFAQTQLSYGELNARANQLAHHLQRLGVGREVMVGLCVERSVEMLVGLLGILKAGGAYIPLDPAYPKERLAFILAETQAPLLLTQQSLVSELPPHQARIVCLDSDWASIAQESVANLQNRVGAQNSAYVIYTSGSTGKPKGVVISQQALVNFLWSMREKLAVTERDVMLATTSLSFDIAALELYLPLLTGAQVVIASRETVIDGQQLAAEMEAAGCTIMQMTPAGWKVLVEAGWQGRPQMRILCGGEALSQKLARILLTKGLSLINLYGPTETTIWSALHRVEHAESAIPLGEPIANTQLYILDVALEPVAIGVPGELYIGGAGLARGYFKRPELTIEKFVPDPFSQVPGACLYKTGDLARYRSNGAIEFLGRIDNQVKVRGFRIELGEVEVALRSHPAVRDAVVVVREDTPDNKRLVAYLIGDQEIATTPESVRAYLGTRLPAYMIPSALVLLEAFPLTPNGKVDRKSLPAPAVQSSEPNENYVAPRRPVEELLADIWADVLDLEQVSVHSNLFDLGGDSIRSIQITTRAQQVGLTITPKQLMRYQTIDSLVNGLMAHPQSAEQVTKIEGFLQTLSAA